MTQAAEITLTRKDFVSNQEVRWCPGCGDYAILAQMQKVLPEIGIPREQIVFVSGIGCSSRFPYYMNTYGVHSIHGRAPTIATGLKSVNPDLSQPLITGYGEQLSRGCIHLMHCIRRNVDVKILLFNNRIYGLTKGQASPTTEFGEVTPTTPYGKLEEDALAARQGQPVPVTVGGEPGEGGAAGHQCAASPATSWSRRPRRCCSRAASSPRRCAAGPTGWCSSTRSRRPIPTFSTSCSRSWRTGA